MSVSPLLVDRIVAEVVRRLASGPGPSTTDAGYIDLASHRVITGDVLAEHAAKKQTIRLAAGAVITPTGRDAIRERQLIVERVNRDQQVRAASGLILQVSTDAASNRLTAQLAWPHSLTETEPAIEQARSAICRGQASLIVLLHDQPERIAAWLNRQSSVWAIAARSVDTLEAAKSDGWNVVCVHAASAMNYRLPSLLQTMAVTAAEGSQ